MHSSKAGSRREQVGRRLVQVGFLLLFLFPLGVTMSQKVSYAGLPVVKSWALFWDPAIAIVQISQEKPILVVLGAPLFLIAVSLVFGRFFCGWICPIGTLLDLVRPLAFWKKPQRNHIKTRDFSRLRYYLLAAILASSFLSLKMLGLFDPLMIFHRASTSLSMNFFQASQATSRNVLLAISLVFVLILILDLFSERFWCRLLCPFGAMLSLVSRYSFLRRHVNVQSCNHCARCVIVCSMGCLSEEGWVNDYTQCTFCMECASACPKDAITFSFRKQIPSLSPSAARVPLADSPTAPLISRREFLGAIGSTALGLSIVPLTRLAPARPVLRPPGALPEQKFVETCILCQECVRVCPTGGLRPAFLEAGLAGIGTPVLVPRQGGCALNPSCPNLCAQICPVDAINPVSITEMKIGLAVVHREVCLAWDQGAKCLVCVEACLNGAAISFNGRITVDANRCTGCGRCESGCPVPGSAIRVIPLS